jgi:Chitin synthase export chaperone
MMVYKYWDSITKEDLEFSVASKTNVWLLGEDKDAEGFGSGFDKPVAYNVPSAFARSEQGY